MKLTFKMATTGQIINGGATIEWNQVTVVSPTKKKSVYTFETKSRYFYGREYTLKDLQTAIEERKDEVDSINRTIVLVGLGGMGKSEVAKAFAEKFHKSYEYIVWIDAQTEESVKASFRKLPEITNIEVQSLDDVLRIQKQLANDYKNGLFIFDNAERLTTENNQLGIEKFLPKTFLENKPIFVVTSRNGIGLWGGMKLKIKCIDIDCLTNEEATNMLKNYLLITKDSTIPQSLEEAISSLVKTLGGYPLGLHLVGSTFYEKGNENSFDEMECKIKAYSDILEYVTLQDISKESKYEVQLELIYKQTINKIMIRDNGKIAVELLNIMSCLEPNGLFLNLIDAIYSGKACKSRWDDANTNPKGINGLKILMDYSIIKKENEDVLRIHRLIQQCAHKTRLSQETMSKICSFFEINEEYLSWIYHVETLMDLLANGVSNESIANKNYILCLLVWQYSLGPFLNLKAVFRKSESCFNDGKSHEAFMYRLAEIYNCLKNNRTPSFFNWVEIETGIRNLPEPFAAQLWVKRALVAFLERCLECEKILSEMMSSTRENVTRFIIGCCMNIFKYEYAYKSSSPNDSENLEFRNTLFDSPGDELRKSLLTSVREKNTEKEIRNHFHNAILDVWGMDWFISTLNFRGDKEREAWCQEYFEEYLVSMCLDNISTFVKSQEFVNGFLAACEFSLRYHVLANQKWDIWKYFRLSFAVTCLFDADKMIYDKFNGSLENSFENTLELLRQAVILNKWNIFRMFTIEMANSLKIFIVTVRNCKWSPRWAMKFLTMVSIPLEALHTKLVPKNFDKSLLYNVGHYSHEESEIFLCNEIYKSWGVDGLTAALNIITDQKAKLHCTKLGNYLVILINVWKTPGNLIEFVKSSNFLNAFTNKVKFHLQYIVFDDEHSVSEYFRLCLVVICLFDADKDFYNQYGDSLNSIFENALEKCKQDSQSMKWIFARLTKSETESNLRGYFVTVENCLRKPKWATDFLKLLTNLPIEALYDNHLYETFRVTFLFNWENTSEEAKENHFWKEVLQIWSVDRFITALDSIGNVHTTYGCTNFRYYLGNVIRVWKFYGNLDKFVQSPDFLKTFTNIGEIHLAYIQFRLEYMDLNYECVSEYFRLCFAVMCLFDADEKIYEDFSVRLDPLFQNALEKLIDTSTFRRWDVLQLLTQLETGSDLKLFHQMVENCLWKPKWATDFLKLITTPQLESLFFEYSSAFFENRYVIDMFHLENASEEERENYFWKEILNRFGVDGFIDVLIRIEDLRINNSLYKNWSPYKFQIYLGNVIKIWKIGVNLGKFVKSPHFLKTFINIGGNHLKCIQFRSETGVSEYFRLCFAVMCLFDADEKIYEDFSVRLDPLFQNALEKLIDTSTRRRRDVLQRLTQLETGSDLKLFHQMVENRLWKPKWATDFLKLITTPQLESLFTEYSSAFFENRYVIDVFHLENASEEERENSFWKEILNKFGVDGYIAALNGLEVLKVWHGSRAFQIYLGNVIRVWKFDGNLDKFVQSPDFLKTFTNIGAIYLTFIRKYMDLFYENRVSEYFRLCFAVMCLFDADEKIYEDFSVRLDPLFQNAFKQLIDTSTFRRWSVLQLLTTSETKNRLKEFQEMVQNCERKPIWALDLLKLLNTPETIELPYLIIKKELEN